jgi:hypothetical protein
MATVTVFVVVEMVMCPERKVMGAGIVHVLTVKRYGVGTRWQVIQAMCLETIVQKMIARNMIGAGIVHVLTVKRYGVGTRWQVIQAMCLETMVHKMIARNMKGAMKGRVRRVAKG